MKNANMNSIEPTLNSSNVAEIFPKTPPTGLAHGADNQIIVSHVKLRIKKFNLRFAITSKTRGTITFKATTKP